mmetsp:Transcript_5806/g.17825  ORF Transcript_5806/g.17825 Transcript_5806/m.17825 type:complete len:205 (-) Transcript_5806:1-615(-)
MSVCQLGPEPREFLLLVSAFLLQLLDLVPPLGELVAQRARLDLQVLLAALLLVRLPLGHRQAAGHGAAAIRRARALSSGRGRRELPQQPQFRAHAGHLRAGGVHAGQAGAPRRVLLRARGLQLLLELPAGCAPLLEAALGLAQLVQLVLGSAGHLRGLATARDAQAPCTRSRGSQLAEPCKRPSAAEGGSHGLLPGISRPGAGA